MSKITETNRSATTEFAFRPIVEQAPYADLLPGGETCSTCWQDFCIANRFGIAAIKDTFNRTFEGFRHDVKVITELSMTCNWMSWRWHSAYEKSHRTIDGQVRDLYISLYEKINAYVYDSGELSEEDVSYYFSVTD